MWWQTRSVPCFLGCATKRSVFFSTPTSRQGRFRVSWVAKLSAPISFSPHITLRVYAAVAPEVYLAAQVTVGFQKRLGDCKAAERFLREESVREAVHAAGQALAPTRLPMKVFPEVEAGVNLFR